MNLFFHYIKKTILIGLLFLCTHVFAEDAFIKIGVLSHRGDSFTLNTWNPTAHYLNAKLPDYDFEIIPLDFDEVDKAVRNEEIDFILVNPGIYVNLEYRYRVSRLATMQHLRGTDASKVFGGVIFTRSDRDDIKTLSDTRGKSFMAVDVTSLGGFQMSWRELNAEGINPYKDFSRLEFGGIHDHVVNSVLSGDIDVGTVRSNILEKMSLAGKIDLNEIRIINPKTVSGFPFRLSTQLYPEWPFSKLHTTSDELAKQVALALFVIPRKDSTITEENDVIWDLPLDYQQVHSLFQELKLPPYDEIGKFTFQDAIEQYWYWVLLALAFLLALTVITSTEIHRNSRLKHKQKRLEKHYEHLLDSVGDGIYGVDLEGKCTFVNKAMLKLTGWSKRDLIGKNQHTILHHTHADGTTHIASECPVKKTTNDSQTRYINDDIFWKKDGSYISVEYSSAAIKGQGNVVTGSVVVFRDTTERKMTEDKNREHQLQLAHVARLSTLGEMASGIAHELNQPLTVIANYSSACMRMLGNDSTSMDQCSAVMEKILKQAVRAGAVIKQIRHFVKKDLPERKPTKISDMLDMVIELTHMEISRKKVNLILDLDPSVEYVVAQDTQIEQVILNLVRNAIEAMENTPEAERDLTIETRKQANKKVLIRISDKGCGMDEDLLDQVFDPFISTKEQGMGLGLSISQGIIESHGDQIIIEANSDIEESTDKGISFSFKLPIVEKPLMKLMISGKEKT